MKFRKKPVVIEAALYDGRIVGDPDDKGGVLPGTCPSWMPAVVERVVPGVTSHGPKAGEIFAGERELFIGTLEGVMTASAGDWIIRGLAGELYPCKPEIFARTYEPAE